MDIGASGKSLLEKSLGKVPASKDSPNEASSPKIATEEERTSSSCKRALSVKSCETLQELMFCSICFEKFRKPKMLPCQHTFCLICLQGCAKHNANNSRNNSAKLSCPQCRLEASIPEGGLAALPCNIYIQRLIDTFESDNMEKEVVRCNTCQTACYDCGACQHCQLVFCAVCLDAHVNALSEHADNIAKQIENNCDLLHKKNMLFDNDFEELKEKIRSEAEIRIQKIKENEESLLDVLNEEAALEAENFQSTMSLLTDVVSVIRNQFSDEFDKLNSASDKITLFMNMRKKATDALSQVSKVGQTKIQFDSDLFNVIIDRQSKSIEAKYLDQLGAEIPPSISPTIRDPSISSSTARQSRYYRMKSFNIQNKIGIGILQRPAGISICPWSKEIYIVSMDSHKVSIFDKFGKSLRSFGSRGQNPGEFLCPFGIAFSNNAKKIIVTDKWKNCLNEYDSEGIFLRQIGLKGRSPGHFRSPEGIATDTNGRMYVCDTGNDRVQVLDTDGTFMFEVGVKNSVEGGTVRQKSFFNEPTGIAVTPKGDRVVVCDYGHHKIRVFKITNKPNTNIPSSAELALTLGTKGQLKGQFINPECVTIDNKGFMLIGDSGNGRIQVCQPDGKVVRVFGHVNLSKYAYFSWISGIAVTDKYEILVSDFKNHCVKIL